MLNLKEDSPDWVNPYEEGIGQYDGSARSSMWLVGIPVEIILTVFAIAYWRSRHFGT